MTFKVGDTVRLTGDDWTNTELDLDRFYTIRSVNDEENGWAVIDTREGWMVDPRPGQPFSAEVVDWPDDTENQEPEPSYYDFPQGIEVRHISAHLTSFGGQALQYVARATRLDGRNKGNPIEDLTKALDFIQWEIDRLRELE